MPAKRTIEQMTRQIDLAMNTISADQKVFGTVLQVLLLNMCAKVSQGDELFHAIRAQVLASIDNTEPLTGDEAQGAERHKQLTKARAVQVLAAPLGIDPDKPPRSDVN